MPVLAKQRHELFCIGVAKGLTPAESYAAAGFSARGARASALRLLRDAQISNRVNELVTLTCNRAAGIPDLTDIEIAIHERDAQVRVKYDRWKELTARKAELEQIKSERARIMLDPANELVTKIGGPSKLAGVSTGLMVLEMKMLGKTAFPTLELDTALLGELRAINREKSALESEIAQLMGFLKPVTLNIDARQDNRQVNTTNVQIVKMVSCPADETGQW